MQGPILRAVVEAAPMDERLKKAWTKVMGDFDDAITDRIEQQQATGLIKPFDVRMMQHQWLTKSLRMPKTRSSPDA